MKKFVVLLLIPLLLFTTACKYGGGDVKPGKPDKRSGRSVYPGGECRVNHQEGSYNGVWYICVKDAKTGKMIWVKK